MYKIVNEIRKIAEKIVSSEKRRKAAGDIIRAKGIENNIIFAESPCFLDNIKVAAVDGGIVKKSFHGIDCALVRSAGVCFTYSRGRVAKVEYFPSRFPSPMPVVIETPSEIDWAYHSSLARLKLEIETAIKSAERFSPYLLLLDGPLIPHYSDRPAKKSPAFSAYTDAVRLYRELFAFCREKGIMLAGVIEDSRSSRFCDILKDKIFPDVLDSWITEVLEKTKDTNMLFWVLKKGERTAEFKYSDVPAEHQVLKDFEEYHGLLHAFYLKTAEWDRPVRVEYLGDKKETPSEIASVILSLSGNHGVYGIPAPLIEADSIAKLSEAEMEGFYSQILACAGNIPSLLKLRRDLRPF